MSKFADDLRARKVFNNFEMLRQFGAAGDVAIEYHRPSEGRMGWCDSCRTDVWSPRAHPKLLPPKIGGGVPYREFLGKRLESFYAARNWAMEEFGHDYAPSPFGGHLPQHVLSKAKNFVRGLTTTTSTHDNGSGVE